jgi:hypothetical protein
MVFNDKFASRAIANGELSRPGHTAKQFVEAKFFRKPRAFEKPLTPRVGCSVLFK